MVFFHVLVFPHLVSLLLKCLDRLGVCGDMSLKHSPSAHRGLSAGR